CEPNPAHKLLSKWEQTGLLKAIITQNIDDLHQQAGSKVIYEFHGNSSRLMCTICETKYTSSSLIFNNLPPLCEKCNGLLKPDFVFFGEGIPEKAYLNSFEAAQYCDLCIIIGTSGEVSPANQIPVLAKKSGAVIIEVNMDKSLYTNGVSDYFLKGSAVEILSQIDLYLEKNK
ncbi:MAG: Sir2 family NAD-dependent protein deacetylase, partial [Ignavibacteria bacterium]|nr:Sir2 family NAD-dependent protein deacetylase [Ignavibacteria bacterium]